jgi:hypothetical protein
LCLPKITDALKLTSPAFKAPASFFLAMNVNFPNALRHASSCKAPPVPRVD